MNLKWACFDKLCMNHASLNRVSWFSTTHPIWRLLQFRLLTKIVLNAFWSTNKLIILDVLIHVSNCKLTACLGLYFPVFYTNMGMIISKTTFIPKFEKMDLKNIETENSIWSYVTFSLTFRKMDKIAWKFAYR